MNIQIDLRQNHRKWFRWTTCVPDLKPENRMLAIIGSGETSPTMVTVHRDLICRFGTGNPRAIVLATPYAFQVNAADVSAKARGYFARSVGLDVEVTPGTSANADQAMASPALAPAGPDCRAAEREAADIRAADWVFSGPGSPPYALTHWQSGPIAAALRDRVLGSHGLTVLASAAAATAGQYTVPVYEIYKAGAAPRWLAGLDLLGPLGLKLAVIPHYDNTEGRNYDTRYCYLGEHRLAAMERQLPADAAILGVDEHTALLIDLRASTAQVRGRGGVTIRRRGTSTHVPAGTTVTISELRELARAGMPGSVPAVLRAWGGRGGAGQDGAGQAEAGDEDDNGAGSASTLPELIKRADSEQDPRRIAEVVLELEAAIAEWGTDTDEDQGTEQARAILRTLIGRLGKAAQAGLADPADRLEPAVRPLIALRTRLRDEGRYADADAIRDALGAARLAIRDTADGTWWEPETS